MVNPVMLRKSCGSLVWFVCLCAMVARGQIDPEPRELIQFGYSQPLEGASPLAAYAFYYVNEPNFSQSNLTLRVALAPVYMDSELGISGLLGPTTDLGIGLAGGGFADDYYEFHDGKYYRGQSFDGDSAEGSLSIYHLFNPGQMIPLYGVLRGREHYSIYERDQTDSKFVLPGNHSTAAWRAGLRLGGREPLLHPDLAAELSAWYEGQYRTDSGVYGYGDRVLQPYVNLYWARALLIYTLPKSKQSIDISVIGGGSGHSDRFSAYRLGGNLPMASEFPLNIPGYFYQELSASSFVDFTAQYTIPIDPGKQWTIAPIASAATMNYIPGLAQPGHFNSGAGIGLGYKSRSGFWQVLGSYGYGFEAIRSGGRGGQTIGIQCQINLVRRRHPEPSELDQFIHYLPAVF